MNDEHNDDFNEDDIPDAPLLDDDHSSQDTDTPVETPEDTGTESDTEDKPESPDKEETPEGEQPPAEGEKPDKQPDAEETAKQERQQQNAMMAERRIAERNRTRQEVAQQLDSVYGPKTAEQLEDEGLEPQQAQIQALREEMAYERQRSTIAELNAGMQSDAVNAMNDFPVFNEKSPDYDPEFTAMVQQQYQVAARLQTDDNGIILNAEVPLYDYYQSMNKIYNRGSSKGSSQGQAEAMQMLSRTEDATGGSSSSRRGEETLEEMGERLADIPVV